MTSSDSHEGWAAAGGMSNAEGATQSSASTGSPRNRVIAIVVAVLALAGLGAAIGLALPNVWTSSPNVPAVQQVTGLTIAAVGLGVGFWGIRRQWKRGLPWDYWRGPLAGVKRSRRKRLVNEVRGREPTEPGTEQMTVLQARLMMQQRSTIVVNFSLAILWIGLLVASPALGRAVLAAVFAVPVVAATPFIERDARAAERYLATLG